MTDMRSETMKTLWASPEWRAKQVSAIRAAWPGEAERNAEMCALYQRGKTLQEIGDAYGVTRERVRQIVARAGVSRFDGGAHVAAIQRRQERLERDRRKKGERKARHLELIARCLALRQAGKSWVEVAVAVGYQSEELRGGSSLPWRIRHLLDRYKMPEVSALMFSREGAPSACRAGQIRRYQRAAT